MPHKLFTCLLGFLALLISVQCKIIVYTTDNTIIEEWSSLEADFGTRPPPNGLRGLLVKGEPEDGCSSLKKPPAPLETNTFITNWVVLIARFNCSFDLKIRNAQAAGYDCAIVHNVNSSDLEIMKTKHPEGINIPSVFVNSLAGTILGEEFVYNNDYYIVVERDQPFYISRPLVFKFTIISVFCIVIVVVFMSLI